MKSAKLTCPNGYTIQNILFANYGDNVGTCRDYSVDSCVSEQTLSVVETACIGQESCTVLANKTAFNSTCSAVAVNLAINAVCETCGCVNATCLETTCTSEHVSWNADTAPSLVAVTTVESADDFICPFDYLGTGLFPAEMEEDLLELQPTAACNINGNRHISSTTETESQVTATNATNE